MKQKQKFEIFKYVSGSKYSQTQYKEIVCKPLQYQVQL